jgi:hypothetical protein
MPKNLAKDFSISKKLRDEKRNNDFFEVMVGNLTLEELIALKLELSYKNLNYLIYGFPLWRATPYIIKDAILKAAISINKSKKGTIRFLGINNKEFWQALKKYKIDDYFIKKEKGDDTN